MENDLKQAFEAGYLAAVMRVKRELPPVWRDAVVPALTGELADREKVAELAGTERQPGGRVPVLRLVILRCEAATTMLRWRKELPEKTRVKLRQAIHDLTAEARRLGAL